MTPRPSLFRKPHMASRWMTPANETHDAAWRGIRERSRARHAVATGLLAAFPDHGGVDAALRIAPLLRRPAT